jgi:hypothetical protein
MSIFGVKKRGILGGFLRTFSIENALKTPPQNTPFLTQKWSFLGQKKGGVSFGEDHTEKPPPKTPPPPTPLSPPFLGSKMVIFEPKRAFFGPKKGLFWAKNGHFWAKKGLFGPKMGIFGPKRAFLGQKWPF